MSDVGGGAHGAAGSRKRKAFWSGRPSGANVHVACGIAQRCRRERRHDSVRLRRALPVLRGAGLARALLTQQCDSR